MKLSKLRFYLLSWVTCTIAFFSPHRISVVQHYLLSMPHHHHHHHHHHDYDYDDDGGVSLELTKLLRNKNRESFLETTTKSDQSTTKVALNFEKLWKTMDGTNQTTTATSTTTTYRRQTKKLGTKDDISAPFENLLCSTMEHSQTHWKRQSLSKETNQTYAELSPFYGRDRRDYELLDKEPDHMYSDIRDPKGLQLLLQQRFEAKKAKDYTQISFLDRRLKVEHGVRVFDYPRIWTTRTDASKASMRRIIRKRHARMKDLFGQTTHPFKYVKSPSGTKRNELHVPLAKQSHIHKSLYLITRYRMDGRNDEANAIQLELLQSNIRINDQLLLWTDDNTLDFDTVVPSIHRAVENETYRYIEEKSIHSPTNMTSARPKNPSYKFRFGGRTMEEDILRRNQRIQQLMDQRSEAHAKGETILFSLVTHELERTYQLKIDDHTKTYRILSKTPYKVEDLKSIPTDLHPTYTCSSFASILFGEDLHQLMSDTKYRQSKYSLPLENQIHRQRIQELVQERIHLREEGRFLEADAIRRELWHTYNVGVNDKLGQYSVGGTFDNSSNELD